MFGMFWTTKKTQTFDDEPKRLATLDEIAAVRQQTTPAPTLAMPSLGSGFPQGHRSPFDT
jgi:hypothetical protein